MLESQWNQLEDFIVNKMEKEHIAGLSIGISKNGTTIFQKGFGFRDLKKQFPVTPETIFGIASVTKSFTTLAILELEERGLLSVEDPVIKHLPEFKITSIKDMNSLKIHHLLSHTTGMPPMERKEQINTYRKHISYIEEAEHELLGDPGEFFSYCNDTFLLLGAIIERLTSRLFRRYMTNQFLEPLDMTRSTFSLEELYKMENVSVPFNFNKKTNQLKKVKWPTLGTYETGGGIRSNVVDLLKYGQIFINDEHSYSQKMLKPVYKVGRDTYYGYALNITPGYSGEYTLVQHGGGQPGVSANFGFVPEGKLVVSVLTNVGGVSAGDIWLAAVNAALGLPLDHKQSNEPIYDLTLEKLKNFEGVFTSKEGGNVLVYLKNEKIFASMEEERFELRASGPDTLVIQKNEKPLRFYFDRNEKPWSLFDGSRMLRRTLE
jgi:CubicO group peptidase (beta-lactamase class C family)